MIAKKIDYMHLRFGKADGICADCPHFVEGRYHDRMLFKCEAYGITHSEATDWRKKWVCCGLKDLPLPYEAPLFDRIKGRREYVPEEQIEGQIGIEEVMECVGNNAVGPELDV